MLTNKLKIKYEVITPKEKPLDIFYGIHLSPFGLYTLGITKKGICHLTFTDSKSYKSAVKNIQANWPDVNIKKDIPKTTKYAKIIFPVAKNSSKKTLQLLIKGSDFQVKVWKALLSIPFGKTVSYSDIAKRIGSPKAVRAVGTACGKNSIGFLIPCHRVLTSNGELGGYRWGIKRKKSILEWELSR